jgi:26S proteasome regulatory subunit T5
MTVVLAFLFVHIKLLDVDPQDQGEEDGAVVDLDSQRKGKCAVIKTSTRQVRN